MKKLLAITTLAFGLTLTAGTFNETAAQNKWSHRKKGAVVGAAAGAATGAVVSRRKGKGAVVGAAVGAGAGYILGRRKDKKEGKL